MIKAGDKIRANGKEIVVRSETESTYFGENSLIHRVEDIEIVKKAEIKDKESIQDIKKGETIRVNSRGGRTGIVVSKSRADNGWTICFKEGRINNINKDLTVGIDGRGGSIEVIEPIKKKNLRCFM